MANILIAGAFGAAPVVNASATAVAGTTRISGTLTPNMVVRAYRRDNGHLVGQAMSDASGNYSVPCGGFTGECYVVALDSDGTGTAYDSKLVDYVTPA